MSADARTQGAMMGSVLARRSRRSFRWYATKWIGPALVFVILLAGCVPFLAPLAFMLSTSVKNKAEIFRVPIRWIPHVFVWKNYADALFGYLPFYLYIFNTLKVVAGCLLGDVFISALAAYGFARLRAPFKNVIFVVVLSTMMLPAQVVLIPTYVLFKWLKLIGSLWSLILPNLGGAAYFIFLFRQFFQTIHPDLGDAAKVDGCSLLATFWRIYLPMSRPALITVSIFSFFGQWNSFLWPLILINKEKNYTVALGLLLFQGAHSTEWGLQMAASMIALVPCLLMFFAAQRYFMQGVVVSGVKG